jgi:hypothetical protein
VALNLGLNHSFGPYITKAFEPLSNNLCTKNFASEAILAPQLLHCNASDQLHINQAQSFERSRSEAGMNLSAEKSSVAPVFCIWVLYF